jgi:hypothetical protein
MERGYRLPEKIIFKAPNVLNQGKFILAKSMFIIDGYNVPRSGRCDTMTYYCESTTINTDFEDEELVLGKYNPYLDINYSIHHVSMSEIVLDVSPLFCIVFTKVSTPGLDGRSYHAPELQEGDYPGATRSGLSLSEFFKNTREWSFMTEEPFNSEHPHAVYSKMLFDTLNPPQEILDEIDAMPEMHLARFLKGDENFRDYVEDFPQMSENMIAWFKAKREEFPRKFTSQHLEVVVI